MGNLRSSYRSPGWGGAGAARPVHPECPDASSGCIEGPAQLSVWGGAGAAQPVHPECPDASSGCIEGPAQLTVWGGAGATRPVHPECPDASSGCIEGPAQLCGWRGAHTSIGDRVARPSSLNTYWVVGTAHLCYSVRVESASVLTPIPFPQSRLGTRRVVSRHGVPTQIGRTRNRVCHLPARCATRQIRTAQNGTQWHSFRRKKRPAASAHSRGHSPHRVRPVARPARAGLRASGGRWNSTSSATDTAPLRTMTAANDQPLSSTGRSMFIP